MAIRTAAASSIVALFMAERFHAGARGNPLFAWKALYVKMRPRIVVTFGPVCLALGMLAGCSHHAANVTTRSAGAGQTATGGAIVVPAGTDYYGKLVQPIGTKTSKDGDTFALNETRSTNQSLTGAVIDGHLENVQSAGPMRNPKMTIVFDDIRLADGTKAPVDVQLVTARAFAPRTHHLRTIGMMIAGAVAGHEVSIHTGRRHGTLLGAASGYALSQSLKTDIAVPAGTVVELRFRSPVTSGAQ